MKGTAEVALAAVMAQVMATTKNEKLSSIFVSNSNLWAEILHVEV